MMQQAKQMQSLSFRLSALIAAIIFAGFCVIASFYILQDFSRTIQSERAQLENAAFAFAAASAGPLAAGDRGALYNVMRGVRDIEHTRLISVVDKNGSSIAEIGNNVVLDGRDGGLDEKSVFAIFNSHSISANADINDGGIAIGQLEIHADISWLRALYLKHLVVMIGISITIALFIALIANRAISRALLPLKQLSSSLLCMGENLDLSTRFRHDKQDEIGVVAQAFNDAFSKIDKRDQEIRHHRDTLEITVEERTQDLKQAVDLAEKANAAKSDFLATMSHEIRTPMNGMMVMAELLSASALAPKQQRFADVISRSGNSLLHIINDILDMSKIEAGKLEIEQIPFSLDTLIEDTVSLYAAKAHEKNLQIALISTPMLSRKVIGDPTRLGQVISNLTNNALKFCETGGVTIDVSCEPAKNNAQAISISVKDTGIGIAPEKLATIFEAFSQADQSTTRSYGGTGLGLSISKRLAEAMGGRIHAKSQLGEGAEFFIDLNLPVIEELTPKQTPSQDHLVSVLNGSEISTASTIESLRRYGLRAEHIGSLDDISALSSLLIVNSNECASITQSALLPPAIIVSEFGGHGQFESADLDVVAQISLPITRNDYDIIANGLLTDNWTFEAIDAENKSHGVRPDFRDIKVLAVDDNVVNREVLNEALLALNVKATFAADGYEAVEIAGKKYFDVIFMDCSMPGMDGYDATAAIRSTNNSASALSQIIALTAHVTGPKAEQWKIAGMDGYIAKPFTVSQISSVLENLTVTPSAEETDDVTYVANDTYAYLISQDTLQMFASIEASTGSNMAAKIFCMFIDKVDQSYQALAEATQNDGDLGAIKELAHALKSMCLSAGAQKAALLCGQIEELASNGQKPTSFDLGSLREIIKCTKSAMAEYGDESASLRLG